MSRTEVKNPHRSSLNLPLLSTLLATTLWGILPVYWRSLQSVPPVEVLSHRVVWSLLFLFAVLMTKGELQRTIQRLSLRVLSITLLSSLLIALNWGLFIYAVMNNRILDASLGYYLNPLLSALVGIICFKEKASPRTIVSILLGAAGFCCMAYEVRGLPILSLLLTISFVLYTVCRKRSPLDSIGGLFVETLLLTPVAGSYLAYLFSLNKLEFAYTSLSQQGLLAFTGVATSLPLLLFAFGARGISLATLGVCQYIGPTLQFLIGWLVYGEVLRVWKTVGFLFIWGAILIYSFGGLYRRMRPHQS